MSTSRVTNIQRGSNGLVYFYDGTDVIRAVSQTAPPTSTYFLYGTTTITLILPNEEQFTFPIYGLLQVGSHTYTALSPTDDAETIQTRVKEIYTVLSTEIFQGESSSTASSIFFFADYTYDSALPSGGWFYASGQLFMSFTSDSNQDFSNLFHHYSSGAWVYFIDKADVTSFSVFEITGYASVSGLASWTATLIDGLSSYADGTEFWVLFDNAGSGSSSGTFQAALDAGSTLDKDNTVDANGHAFTWNNVTDEAHNVTGQFEVTANGGGDHGKLHADNALVQTNLVNSGSGTDAGFKVSAAGGLFTSWLYAIAGAASTFVKTISNSLRIGTPAVTGGTATAGHPLKLSNATSGEVEYGQLGTVGIADQAVTYVKIQNVSATDKILGRSTAGAGTVEEITCTAAGRAILDDADAAAQRTTLGGTTVGSNFFTLTNPSAVRFIRINADNTITVLDAASFLAAIGGQASGSYLVSTNNLSDVSSAATSRTNLGATTLGGNLFTVTNPSAITFFRANADNTVTMRTASEMVQDLGVLDSYPIGASGALNPTDATTYYFGGGANIPLTPTSTAARRRTYVSSARTIVAVDIQVFTTVAATNEAVSIYVRVNNTTDTTLTTTMTWNAGASSYNLLSVTGLSISLNAGDYYEIKIVTPTWATNPTGVTFTGSVQYRY